MKLQKLYKVLCKSWWWWGVQKPNNVITKQVNYRAAAAAVAVLSLQTVDTVWVGCVSGRCV